MTDRPLTGRERADALIAAARRAHPHAAGTFFVPRPRGGPAGLTTRATPRRRERAGMRRGA